ncbi:hypothetical protein [Streptomyces sp. NPDC001292]|uniref:hypothetical protein n=1 Tax=Streptomyces sp. NPDC001292 TaxID=3364558 RepID=UPI0036ACB499
MHWAEQQLVAPGRRTLSAVSAPEPPAQWRRVRTLPAVVSLFIGTRAVWTLAASRLLPVAGVICPCYASILVCAVLTPVVRRTGAVPGAAGQAGLSKHALVARASPLGGTPLTPEG